jgi:hypothetical protein
MEGKEDMETSYYRIMHKTVLRLYHLGGYNLHEQFQNLTHTINIL